VSKRARVVLIALIAVLVVASIAAVVGMRSLEPRLQAWLVENLGESFEGKVDLEGVRLTWVPFRLHAKNLTVRHHGRTDIPPLLIVSSFVMDLQFTDLWSSTVDRVWVDGLEINIPPKDAATGKRPIPRPSADNGNVGEAAGPGIIIRRVTATNTRLAVIPRESSRNARVWDIFELELKNLGNGEPVPFTAALINPIPYGKVDSSGHFGPWNADDPGSSPVSGQYTFAADLGTIEGLAGDLSARGDMTGTIERISTKGETQTPNFKLTELDGSTLPLRTAYDAIVDGTNGDVELKTVDVTLGKSRLMAHGLVDGTKGVKGKRIVVNVKSSATNLAEILRLISKSPRPVAHGVLTIDAAMDLLQGTQPVLQRLSIAGSVNAERLTFSSEAVRDKIDDLSRRGQGKPSDATIKNVPSRMKSTFTLDKGVFRYSNLTFAVNGATINVNGTHSLKSRAVDLAGVVLLSASASNTMTGFKSWVLKPFDALFRRNGAGTRLVITVAGTQDEPTVDVEIGRSLRGQ
jgi:hypothetical protein